jgi:hypothetical protein
MDRTTTLADAQRQFYERLWRAWGDDPRSLSYRDAETQHERFFRLTRAFHQLDCPFTVHEVGCGLGHFGEYLQTHVPHAVYSGTDLCREFVECCRRKFPGGSFHLRDFLEHDESEHFDFLTLSGSFNPRLDAPPDAWRDFITGMLRKMYACCRCGLAVNFLSPFCDPGRRDDALHYQDPWELLAWVAGDLSRHVELDWGGPLFEYTLRIYRPEYVSRLYPAPEFDRYFKGRRPVALP